METTLPKTLASLKAGGFDSPRLFVDGTKAVGEWEERFGLPVTGRFPVIRAYGNWVLSLAELAIREPQADRFAIFQDDLVMSRNARQYLERCRLAEDTYWNLYTFPSYKGSTGNEQLCGGRVGWHPSNQRGWGALALVFTRVAVIRLLTSQHMVAKPFAATNPDRNIDGAVVEAFHTFAGKELVHFPSLVQHTGNGQSAIGQWSPNHAHKQHPLSPSFRGEDFDALSLLGAA